MKNKGFTLIELIIVVIIITILASTTLPISRIAVIRSKEILLKENLRKIRSAIDEYKKLGYGKKDITTKKKGYPSSLNKLVEKKVIRRIPKDPFSVDEGGDPDSWWVRIPSEAGGVDWYDIKTKNDGEALDGSKYKTW